MSAPDMDVIKEIPGYKVILKAVLKSQIQQLVEQLASHTDEESVILTASVSDGTLSHLGSDSGKFFLDDHEDIKSQFLGFCLKRHHRKKVEQQKTTPPMGSSPWPSHMGQSPGPRPRLGPQNRQSFPRQGMPRHPMSMPTKNLRHEPYPISKPRRSGEGNVGILDASVASPSIKLEPDDSSQHSRNDSESSNDGNNQNNQQGLDNQVQGVNVPSSDSNTSDPQTSTSDIDPNVKVKVEAISEADMELEITGVELGNNSDALRSPNTSMGYDASQVLGAMGSMGDMQAQPDYSEGTNLFQCPICGKVLKNKYNLQVHMRCHTGEKPYECSVCHKRFTQKTHMKSHFVTVHFDK